MSADHDWNAGRERPHLARQGSDVVALERVHRGDADQRGAVPTQVVIQGTAEPQVRQCDPVPARLERRRDVFHPERLDAKEGAQPESFVPGDRAKQQDMHFYEGGRAKAVRAATGER